MWLPAYVFPIAGVGWCGSLEWDGGIISVRFKVLGGGGGFFCSGLV